MIRNKIASLSLRSLAAAAALSIAPIMMAAPASALAVGQTVCYGSDGGSVVNPPNPDDFDYCVTREPYGGGGGGGGPRLCTITSTSFSCVPIVPLQG